MKFQLDMFANPFWQKLNIIDFDETLNAIDYPHRSDDNAYYDGILRREIMCMSANKLLSHEFDLRCHDGFIRRFRLTPLQEYQKIEINDLVEFTEHAPLALQSIRLFVLDIQECNEFSLGDMMSNILVSGQFMPNELRLIKKFDENRTYEIHHDNGVTMETIAKFDNLLSAVENCPQGDYIAILERGIMLGRSRL